MRFRLFAGLAICVTVLAGQGCASGGDTLSANPYRLVPISEGVPAGQKYKEIGPVEATLRRETTFDREPTRENVNLLLEKKARDMGADAVIQAEYQMLQDEQNWNYLVVKGVAVKYRRD